MSESIIIISDTFENKQLINAIFFDFGEVFCDFFEE